MDITQPLKRGFFLRRPGEEDLWVKFRYERLSDFCYCCGRVGHNFNECKERDESKEKPVFDGDLRAEISWLDTINFGNIEPTKLIYPVSKKRSSRGGDDGGAAASPADVSISGALAFSDCEKNNLIGSDQNRTRVVEEASEEPVGLQVLSPDVSSVSNRTKDVGPLSADVGSPHALASLAAIQIVPSPKSASGLGSQSLIGSQTSGQLDYFVEEPVSPSNSQWALVDLESDESIPPKLSKNPLLGQAEVSLSNIFNRLLNIKRKHGDESKRILRL